MIDKKCEWCGCNMSVRTADVSRGWGKFCSKSCKAKKQEKKNGQHAAYLNGRGVSNLHPKRLQEYSMYEDDTHPFSSEGLGQWTD
jgi:hypothetical protein